MESNIFLPEYMAKQKEVWQRIVKRYNIDEATFEYTNWMFMRKLDSLDNMH